MLVVCYAYTLAYTIHHRPRTSPEEPRFTCPQHKPLEAYDDTMPIWTH
jgi:hypothetical protein